jgi:ferredoxin
MMKKPVVDLACCHLCAVCVEVCPEVFQISDAGFLEVADLKEYPEAGVQEAIRYCPDQCISYEEEG